MAAHALSDCDIVPKLFGIGKKKVFIVLNEGFYLQNVGNVTSNIETVFMESAKFVSACCGFRNETDLWKVRFTFYGKRTGTKVSSIPKLQLLPPTKEFFKFNILRAHFQACFWMSCLNENPLDMEPLEVI